MRAEGGERAFVSHEECEFLDECHEWPGSFGDDLVVINAFGLSLENGFVFLSDRVEVIMFWF
ncbi:hypothetical protein KSMBR1_3894 [Candidatus Kuenenia stuttgartiensis]|uniref:Uncharacterized protein n=1 Tax=Kuenenia stuttgartiensis TaxID=174633 RepID=A0A2C9CAH3_KUEST|nr:hypothetical protein KSMBR1_0041 [Candidatus Kuenenia stuttgartiensis]SOH06366.1 hypothetical protein KSMBR1_3894 [Candidatus Kuenenia stuttgartiensis]